MKKKVLKRMTTTTLCVMKHYLLRRYMTKLFRDFFERQRQVFKHWKAS
jgi:hypothetical protein